MILELSIQITFMNENKKFLDLNAKKIRIKNLYIDHTKSIYIVDIKVYKNIVKKFMIFYYLYNKVLITTKTIVSPRLRVFNKHHFCINVSRQQHFCSSLHHPIKENYTLTMRKSFK